MGIVATLLVVGLLGMWLTIALGAGSDDFALRDEPEPPARSAMTIIAARATTTTTSRPRKATPVTIENASAVLLTEGQPVSPACSGCSRCCRPVCGGAARSSPSGSR